MAPSNPISPALGFFLSLLALSVLQTTVVFAGTIAPQETVKEPESGKRFAVVLSGAALGHGVTHPGSKQPVLFADQALLGVGIREKTIFGVDVYAMGIYIEPNAARQTLERWEKKTAKELQKDGALYDALLRNGLPTTLRLEMCRDVDGSDMAEAFDESLGPRMMKLFSNQSLKLPRGVQLGKVADLQTFRKLFAIDEVKSGVELLFTWDKDGVLYTRVGGKSMGGIHSYALSRALFDVYLGADPISKSAKKAMIKRLPVVLQVKGSDE